MKKPMVTIREEKKPETLAHALLVAAVCVLGTAGMFYVWLKAAGAV